MTDYKPTLRESEILSSIEAVEELSHGFALKMGWTEPDFRSLLTRQLIESDQFGYSLTEKGEGVMDAAYSVLVEKDADA